MSYNNNTPFNNTHAHDIDERQQYNDIDDNRRRDELVRYPENRSKTSVSSAGLLAPASAHQRQPSPLLPTGPAVHNDMPFDSSYNNYDTTPNHGYNNPILRETATTNANAFPSSSSGYYPDSGDYDSEYYRRPGTVSANSPYYSKRLSDPVEYVNTYNPSTGGNDGDAYLLDTYNHQPNLSQTNFNSQYQNFNGSTGFGYAFEHAGPDESFQPFPITGESYDINTYDVDLEDQEDKQMYNVEEQNVEEDAFGNIDIPLEIPPDGPQLRRNKTTKKIKLMNGNLVLDCPVSKQMLNKYTEKRSEREFTFMRYSAATTDPKDFIDEGFTLRQLCYKQPRKTELMIIVTMYNEDDVLLGRTLKGVFKNIKHLMGRDRSKTWGKDAWKKIVVCIVSDGRTKINKRAQALLASLGVYQEGFAKNMVNDKPVSAHIYEYTTMVGISSIKHDKVKITTEQTVPVQLLFCLKEKNQKKINSHRWCFQAFAPLLQPEVIVLLDAGTQPGSDSIYHLWKEFDRHPNVGGACGEIKAMLGSKFKYLLNPLVASQNFEYKISNILDKPMESVFGFIGVLPGAFSAYRYRALLNDINGVGPLEKYFKGETLHDSNTGLFTSNMYLAEDRILCFELVAKKGCSWILKYCKSASAETDVPSHLSEFILQRRRWLNGSFFAAIYSVFHFFKIFQSSHSPFRLLMLSIEFLYQTINLLVSWFSIGSFFLVFRILTSSLGDKSVNFSPGGVLSIVFLWLYVGCLVSTFVLSFGNKPQGTKKFYIVIVAFFAILMCYLIFAAIFLSVKAVQEIIKDHRNDFSFKLILTEATFRDLVVSMLSTYALYFICSFLYFEPWHMFTSFFQYLLISPTYINVLNVYAFCNIHDISWGTKGDTGQKLDLGIAKVDEAGKLEVDIPTQDDDIDRSYATQIKMLLSEPEPEVDDKSSEEIGKDYYAFIRSSVVLSWMFSNFVIIAVVLQTGGVSAIDTGSANNVVKRAVGAVGEVVVEVVKRSADLQQRQQIYLTVILWTVAFMAMFRFIGSVAYLVLRILGS